MGRPFFDFAGSVGLAEAAHRGDGGGEQHRVAVPNGLAAQGHGQVGLAHPGRAEQRQGVALGDPAAGDLFPEPAGVDLGPSLGVA